MVQMKKAGMLAAAALLSAGLSVTVPGAEYSEERASSYSARFYTGDEDGAWEEADSGNYDHTKDKEAQMDAAHGPGASAASGEDAAVGMGPTIREVAMREQHHEEYGLYEESIEGKFFLYANVPNGGVTDKPAYLEIPAGLDYRAEKDGVPFPYTSGQQVGEKGTYVIYITAIEDRNAPLSQQTELRTVFRFRIDHKLAEYKDALGDGIAAAGQAAGGLSGLPQGYVEGGLDALLGASGQGETGKDGTADASGQGETGKDGTAGASGQGERPETSGETPETENIGKEDGAKDRAEKEAEAGAGAADESAKASGGAAKTGEGLRSQVYQPEDSMYRVVLEDGFTFFISVPEGMVTTRPVSYRAEGEYQLFLGDEETRPVEDPQADPQSLTQLQSYGKYRLVSGGYEYPFEITDPYVKLDSYSAPAGMVIAAASFDGKALDTGDGTQVPMTVDGDYLFTLKGEEGQEEEVKLTRDTAPPDVTVDVGRQNAVITYMADDIAGITLSKNGGEPQKFNGVEVSSPGRYVLTVTDRAGNVTAREFALRYHMNVYALFVVILTVAGIAAAVVILIRKKKNLTVR